MQWKYRQTDVFHVSILYSKDSIFFFSVCQSKRNLIRFTSLKIERVMIDSAFVNTVCRCVCNSIGEIDQQRRITFPKNIFTKVCQLEKRVKLNQLNKWTCKRISHSVMARKKPHSMQFKTRHVYRKQDRFVMLIFSSILIAPQRN